MSDWRDKRKKNRGKENGGKRKEKNRAKEKKISELQENPKGRGPKPLQTLASLEKEDKLTEECVQVLTGSTHESQCSGGRGRPGLQSEF